MTIYRAKSLINGFKLGQVFGGLTLVAIPKHFLKTFPVCIWFQNSSMTIEQNQLPLTEKTFPDQYGRGPYTLCYFEWKPTA